ncbi:MAG: translation initiation factor IF-3 [Sneathiellaceae bacterium]
MWRNLTPVRRSRRIDDIARPPIAQPPSFDGPRVNERITSSTVRLIDHEGNNHGVVPTDAALETAMQVGMDLVEISPNADPPVCKLLDYGKYKYEAQKKASEARKKQKVIEVKEIKMRPNIDQHDYDVKMRSMNRFLVDGDKVKVTLRFRGREMAHQDLGRLVLERVQQDLSDRVKVEQWPKMEGRQMTMVIAPK